MADQNRNFRSSYLGKVGIKGVEEKKSLEIILKDPTIDSTKLAQFCLRYSVPAAYRLYLWKILLGILPPCPEAHEFVWKQRQMQYQDLEGAIHILRTHLQDAPQEEVHLRMYLVEQGRLPLDESRLFEEPSSQAFMAISHVMSEVTEEAPASVYWLTKALYNLQISFKEHIPFMVEHVEHWLRKEDDSGRLLEHLKSLRAFHLLPLSAWFHSCYADILPLSSIERIWDKVIGGSSKILVCVAVAILLTFKRPILSFNSIEEVKQYLAHIPEDSGDIIVGEAIKIWQKHGNHLNPMSGRGDSPNMNEKPGQGQSQGHG